MSIETTIDSAFVPREYYSGEPEEYALGNIDSVDMDFGMLCRLIGLKERTEWVPCDSREDGLQILTDNYDF